MVFVYAAAGKEGRLYSGLGYTRDDLEFMDEEERAEILEDAGLDPDDWD